MDWLKDRKRLLEIFEKYKFVLLIVVVGIFLMLLPTEKKPDPQVAETVQPITGESLETELAKILSQIRGVGRVQVMITEQTGSETVYQVDEDRTEGESGSGIKRETVIVSGGGTQSGLVLTVTPPTYLGAIIVCQGAESPAVRLAVVNAVCAVTGISTDRISVLEMK